MYLSKPISFFGVCVWRGGAVCVCGGKGNGEVVVVGREARGVRVHACMHLLCVRGAS